jgi:hypothetical protein
MTPPRCPECGWQVVYDLTCRTHRTIQPGYPDDTEHWRACSSCDSAVEYVCARDLDDAGQCGWRYTHGLDIWNPRAAGNEMRRPPWIPGGQECGEWRAPGVPLLGGERGE